MTPDYQQALEWCNEYFAEKRPDLAPIELKKKGTDEIGMVVWSDEYREYDLFIGDFEIVTLQCVAIEIRRMPVFSILVPATKQEFFSVLNILDKQEN